MPARHHRTLLPYTATLCAAAGSGLAYAYWISARTRLAGWPASPTIIDRPATASQPVARSRRRAVGRHRAPTQPFGGFSRYLNRRHGWAARLQGPTHRLSVG